MFSTNIEAIEKQIRNIDIENYAKTRNYGNGSVTRLSPYISICCNIAQVHWSIPANGCIAIY